MGKNQTAKEAEEDGLAAVDAEQVQEEASSAEKAEADGLDADAARLKAQEIHEEATFININKYIYIVYTYIYIYINMYTISWGYVILICAAAFKTRIIHRALHSQFGNFRGTEVSWR